MKIEQVALFGAGSVGGSLLCRQRENLDKIKVIVHSIEKDGNEDIYDLEKYDDEIACAQQELSDIAAKKKDAAETTGTVAQNVISGGNADELQAKFLTPKKDEPDNNQPVGIKDELPVYLL